MLKRIMELLEEHGRLSLGELAWALESEPEAVEPMMTLLEQKGKVVTAATGCSGRSCSGCACSSRNDSLIYGLPRGL